MKKGGWTKNEKLLVALTVTVVASCLGLFRGAKYPALLTYDFTLYPRGYDEAEDYRETTRCWGVPIVFWTCRTTLSAPDSESG